MSLYELKVPSIQHALYEGTYPSHPLRLVHKDTLSLIPLDHERVLPDDKRHKESFPALMLLNMTSSLTHQNVEDQLRWRHIFGSYMAHLFVFELCPHNVNVNTQLY